MRTFAIAEEKLTRYLLDPRQSKHAFFTAFGFSADRPDDLASALHDHVTSPDILVFHAPHPLGYGTNWKCIGPLKTPDGRNPNVLSLWLESREGLVNFVTAYPKKPR